MIDRQSIRFRIAIIVSLAIFISLGGFALFLYSEIRGINERDLDATAGVYALDGRLTSITDGALEEIVGGVAADNARITREVLAGRPGPQRIPPGRPPGRAGPGHQGLLLQSPRFPVLLHRQEP